MGARRPSVTPGEGQGTSPTNPNPKRTLTRYTNPNPTQGDKRASCSLHLNAAEMMHFTMARCTT